MKNNITQRQHHLSSLTAQLEMLNPQRTLERGYAIVTDAKGQVVRSPKQIHPRENIMLRCADGAVQLGITSVQAIME